MTIREVLESAKDQILHLDKHAQALDEEGEFHYPLFSTNKTVDMLDEVIAEDINQELITRLYDLKNAVESADAEMVILRLSQTNETLKKVIYNCQVRLSGQKHSNTYHPSDLSKAE